MSRYTQGPWHVVEDRTPTSLEVFAGKIAIAELWRRLDRHTEMANAKLIAAAPDLLEALQYARRFMRKDLHDTDYIDGVIAKATGEINEP